MMKDETKNQIRGGMLYLVATPIGNLSDLSERAVKVLSEVDFIAAEDTRNSLRLLTHLGISKPMPIDFMGHSLEELRDADAARPAKRPKNHVDILHEVANHNQDLLKKAGDHVIFPQAADDYAKGFFEIRNGRTFYKGEPVKTVEYGTDSKVPIPED